MTKKEHTTISDLFQILDLLESLDMQFWLDGGWYEFQPDYFGTAVFEGRSIPCISAKGQQVFHSGYDLREKDIHDLSIIHQCITTMSLTIRQEQENDRTSVLHLVEKAFADVQESDHREQFLVERLHHSETDEISCNLRQSIRYHARYRFAY